MIKSGVRMYHSHRAPYVADLEGCDPQRERLKILVSKSYQMQGTPWIDFKVLACTGIVVGYRSGSSYSDPAYRFGGRYTITEISDEELSALIIGFNVQDVGLTEPFFS